MSQHDMDIGNAGGAGIRADLNLALLALASNNSGATAPTATFAYMWWPDTTTGLLKQRNAGNSAWVTIGSLADLGIQSSVQILAAAAGTADAITATYVPAVPSLTNGLTLYVRAGLANATTTPTFSPNGLAAKIIVKGAGSALAAGDIAGAGHWVEVQYDATLDKWVLLNPATGVGVVALATTATKLSTAAGSAPSYSARAWCVFDGTLTGTNAPTAGKNVTSVTRTSTGNYILNFTVAMADANYGVTVTASSPLNGSLVGGVASKTTTQCAVRSTNPNVALSDSESISVTIFF